MNLVDHLPIVLLPSDEVAVRELLAEVREQAEAEQAARDLLQKISQEKVLTFEV